MGCSLTSFGALGTLQPICVEAMTPILRRSMPPNYPQFNINNACEDAAALTPNSLPPLEPLTPLSPRSLLPEPNYSSKVSLWIVNNQYITINKACPLNRFYPFPLLREVTICECCKRTIEPSKSFDIPHYSYTDCEFHLTSFRNGQKELFLMIFSSKYQLVERYTSHCLFARALHWA